MKFPSAVFGPVKSRRLGLSLGVDPLGSPKACSFDCLYCEIGPTKIHTLERRIYRPTAEVKEALRQKLKDPELHFEVLTFAGLGEPTLHLELGELLTFARELTDRPLCLLTNSSLFWQKEVREAVRACDIILPSLDAGREETFKRLNRPVEGLSLARIIAGLKALREEFSGEMWLEIMLVAGVNDTEEELQALTSAVKEIAPDRVQLNTIDRPPAYPEARALPLEKLEELAALFTPQAEVISREALEKKGGRRAPKEEEILALVSRRPCPSEEISEALSCDFKATLGLLQQLVKEGKLKTRVHQRRLYYYL
ncbi:MAG: radical SAM protein [Thermodesulfobacteria bacterium]|nr:radical SAM protein [Thermodesulfobacteriota bacterium]